MTDNLNPMSTAPRDGTVIFLRVSNTSCFYRLCAWGDVPPSKLLEAGWRRYPLGSAGPNGEMQAWRDVTMGDEWYSEDGFAGWLPVGDSRIAELEREVEQLRAELKKRYLAKEEPYGIYEKDVEKARREVADPVQEFERMEEQFWGPDPEPERPRDFASRSPILPLGANGEIARALAERDGGVLLRDEDGWVEWVDCDDGLARPCHSGEAWHWNDLPADACAPLPGASPWLSGPPPAEVPDGWELHVVQVEPMVPGRRWYGSDDWERVRQYVSNCVTRWTLLPAPPAEEEQA